MAIRSIGWREFAALLGAAATASLVRSPAARAQQPMPVIGCLSSGTPETDIIRMSGFQRGLNETGYVEAKNVAIEYWWAEGHYDQLQALAADLVRRQVTVIAAIGGTPAALAAKAATSTIPIVFNLGTDPVQFGLVASINRPGGNATGVAVLLAELEAKRLDFLHELLPKVTVVALLVNPNNSYVEPETKNVREVARSLGLQLHVLPASTASEIDSAFAQLVERGAGALVVGADPLFTSRNDQIVALAARHALPAIYAWAEFAAAGGLISYAPKLADGYRLAGVYVGQILKGAKPADLPVQQAAKIELIINLKTANALAGFAQGLQQAGWTVGQNLRIDYRWGDGNADLMRKLAAELVALAPDVILAHTSGAVVSLLQATRTIPIVFTTVADPVAVGLVNSLARPGGNVTGFTNFEYAMGGKWLELLKDISPRVTRVAVLGEAATAAGLGQFGAIQAVAPALGVELRPVDVRDAGEIERDILAFAQGSNGGLIVTGSAPATVHRDLIIALAARHRLPAVYNSLFFVSSGGLIGYATDLVDQFRRAAGYVDRILKGEKPADLSVQAPTKYELAINLKTAKALGLEVPLLLLVRANEVIE